MAGDFALGSHGVNTSKHAAVLPVHVTKENSEELSSCSKSLDNVTSLLIQGNINFQETIENPPFVSIQLM